MKILRIKDGIGEFFDRKGKYSLIDQITKEDLLHLVSLTLAGDEVEIDEFVDGVINNQAQQIVYRSIFEKINDLNNRKKSFKDEAKRMYLPDHMKYRVQDDSSKARPERSAAVKDSSAPPPQLIEEDILGEFK